MTEQEAREKPYAWVDLVLKSAREGEELPGTYLVPGQTCPNCGFAKLQDDELGNLTCPICGFGVVRPCT